MVDCVEDRATWTDSGEKIPVNTARPNPNGIEFDNLYLDMNGIIHPAAHPEDRPPPETEDDMYLSIFAYLERVFAAARPRKLLYMAIDGVAPRAKMNQQRARRFRSAQEAEEKEVEEERLREMWAKEGRDVPARKEGKSFDTNTITPGTPFMDRCGYPRPGSSASHCNALPATTPSSSPSRPAAGPAPSSSCAWLPASWTGHACRTLA